MAWLGPFWKQLCVGFWIIKLSCLHWIFFLRIIIHIDWVTITLLTSLASFSSLLRQTRGFWLPFILGLGLCLELHWCCELAEKSHFFLLLTRFMFSHLFVKLRDYLILFSVCFWDLWETASCLLLFLCYLWSCEHARIEGMWAENISLLEKTGIEANVELRVILLVYLNPSACFIETYLLRVILKLMWSFSSSMIGWH